MRRALFMGCVCWAGLSCATHRESAVQVDAAAQQEEESHAAETVEIHRTEDPSRTVTTVEEFGPVPSVALAGDDSGDPARQDARQHVSGQGAVAHGTVPVVLPLRGPLIKLTTITEDRGAVLETATAKGSSESTAAAREALSGKGDSEADSKPKLFGLGLGLSAGLILAGVAALLILTRGMWIPFLAKHVFGGVN